MIKNNEKSTAVVDDQYYAIKDNVSSGYNKVEFKPKVIPDDPNYWHALSFKTRTLRDDTYNHAVGNATLLHPQSNEDINGYYNLNKRKPKKENQKAVVGNDQAKQITEEAQDDDLFAHDYFVLENEKGPRSVTENGVPHTYFAIEKGESESADIGTTIRTYEGSHDNFSMNLEEESGCVASGTNFDPGPNEVGVYLKYNILDETQPYFENPLSTELEDDIHQYQAMDQPVATTCAQGEHSKHDYFILEKETE